MPADAEIRSGPWDADRIAEHLRTSVIPVRIASAGTFPLVQSLWFLPDGLDLWCATQAESLLARRLRTDARCGFEVAGDLPPYRGVRGTALATVSTERVPDVLPALIARYEVDPTSDLARWLLSRMDTEVAIRIAPRTLASWDYSHRMDGVTDG